MSPYLALIFFQTYNEFHHDPSDSFMYESRSNEHNELAPTKHESKYSAPSSHHRTQGDAASRRDFQQRQFQIATLQLKLNRGDAENDIPAQLTALQAEQDAYWTAQLKTPVLPNLCKIPGIDRVPIQRAIGPDQDGQEVMDRDGERFIARWKADEGVYELLDFYDQTTVVAKVSPDDAKYHIPVRSSEGTGTANFSFYSLSKSGGVEREKSRTYIDYQGAQEFAFKDRDMTYPEMMNEVQLRLDAIEKSENPSFDIEVIRALNQYLVAIQACTLDFQILKNPSATQQDKAFVQAENQKVQVMVDTLNLLLTQIEKAVEKGDGEHKLTLLRSFRDILPLVYPVGSHPDRDKKNPGTPLDFLSGPLDVNTWEDPSKKKLNQAVYLETQNLRKDIFKKTGGSLDRDYEKTSVEMTGDKIANDFEKKGPKSYKMTGSKKETLKINKSQVAKSFMSNMGLKPKGFEQEKQEDSEPAVLNPSAAEEVTQYFDENMLIQEFPKLMYIYSAHVRLFAKQFNEIAAISQSLEQQSDPNAITNLAVKRKEVEAAMKSLQSQMDVYSKIHDKFDRVKNVVGRMMDDYEYSDIDEFSKEYEKTYVFREYLSVFNPKKKRKLEAGDIDPYDEMCTRIMGLSDDLERVTFKDWFAVHGKIYQASQKFSFL